MDDKINQVVNGTISELLSIQQRVDELLQQAEQLRAAALQPLLQWLAESKTVSLITVRGYTPSFNDGEPCEHTSDCYINVRQHVYEEIPFPSSESIEEELLEDYLYTPSTEALQHNASVCEKHKHVYDLPPQEIISAIHNVIYESIEKQYSTNYIVQFVLRDGRFERTDDDFYIDY